MRCVTGRSSRILPSRFLPRCRVVGSEDCWTELENSPRILLWSRTSGEDEEGREIGDILIDDFLFSYWVDHRANAVMIVDVEDAS